MKPFIFSKKQRQVLTWWRPSSPYREHQAIICDGAVRSGKTLCTGLSFFCWAMSCFQGKTFALCGKSVPSVRRNLLSELLPLLRQLGFVCWERTSRNQLTVSLGRRSNTFYLFGGLDERSAALVQGITLAGALLDEVALMPRSFVEQVCARCSVEGSRLWFSCNPESPAHWFYQEWIQKAEEKKALRLSFAMTDNPSLSPAMLERYRTLFQGAFYRRFVLGEWVNAEGLVYDFFSQDLVREPPLDVSGPFYVSCDYGTVNPTSMGLWGEKTGCGTGWRSTTTTPARPESKKRTRSTPTTWTLWSKAAPWGRWWWTPLPPASSRYCGGEGSRYGRLTTTCSPASGSPPGCSKKVSWSSVPPAGTPFVNSACTVGTPAAAAATGW